MCETVVENRKVWIERCEYNRERGYEEGFRDGLRHGRTLRVVSVSVALAVVLVAATVLF